MLFMSRFCYTNFEIQDGSWKGLRLGYGAGVRVLPCLLFIGIVFSSFFKNNILLVY